MMELEESRRKILKMGNLGSVDGTDLMFIFTDAEKVLKSLMPYEAKNGVYFSDRSSSFTCSYGLLKISSTGKMDGKFGVLLVCSILDCDGSIKCEVSTQINALNEEAFEKIAIEVEHRVVSMCNEKLKEFGRKVQEK